MFARCAIAAIVLAVSSPVLAATYEFSFAPDSANLAGEGAGNSATLAALISLLHDYQNAPGLHFKLVGEVPTKCAEMLECPENQLLQQRVGAVVNAIMARPNGAALTAQLRWESLVSAKNSPSHTETVWLALRVDAPALWSHDCPYHLQINDPRLPPRLSVTGQDGEWLDLQSAATVPLSAAASVRVSLPESPETSGSISVQQIVEGRNKILGRSPSTVSWLARDIDWRNGAADIDIDPQLSSRGIGNSLVQWDAAASGELRDVESGKRCRTHFVLTH